MSRNPLAEFFEPPDWVVVKQDGHAVSSQALLERASEFAEQLKAVAPARVALNAVRADNTLAALMAAHASGCELMLLRDLSPPDDSFWQAHQIAAVFDEQLRLLHQPGGSHRPQQAAVLLTTSGTTGKPKVVTHEFQKLLGRVRSEKTGNRWLLTYHPASFAGMQVLLTAVCSRSLLVAFRGLSASELVLKAVSTGVTHLSGTPTFWRSLLLALPSNGESPSFQQITLGGEVADQSTLDALHAAFPKARIVHIYASTEAGALFAVKDMRAGFPAQWLVEGVDGCRLRIQESVLQVQSPRAMKSLSGVTQHRSVTDDGWLITGDLVEIVGERVFFRGRVDNILNVGGGKVMPEQVEAQLLELSLVREARVYGIKNPLAGDVLAADIVLASDISEADARKQIFSSLLARLEPYKVPRLFRFVEEIPTSAMGKKVRTNL